jgi:predicted ATPase/DNA-binding SARP family transcriptional activator/Tfp pilus assembly protein PilF
MLQIQLFGHLRLLLEGEPYRLATLPKSVDLLAYLLLKRQTAVPRDHLAYLLWDDVPESEARANLRRHLHDLRRALPSGIDWLLSDGKTVQWNLEAPFWLDVAEFARLCQDDNRLAEAVILYTGDLLQSSYADWVEPERERLQSLYFSALSRLISRERQRGDLAQAQAYARQLLNRDPWREDALRDYMQLRAESGDRAGALHAYQQFEARLAEEMGVAPMPKTTAVYEQLARPQAPLSPPAPPIPTAPAHNLPARLTSFVGREEELAQVCRLIGAPDAATRLLTITGPGGAGKTRLAVEAANWLWQHQAGVFPDGLYFVGLSAVARPDMVLTAVAETLQARGAPNLSPLDTLKAFLREKRLLLLLDNFEHLQDAAPLLVELLTTAPHLRLLVTSQALLHLYGEQEYPLSPLALPDPALASASNLLDYPAVRLFVERLQAVQPHFELDERNATAVAQICHYLDGLPLALELAAARGKLFPPAAMVTQLRQQLRFLTSQARNLPNRHQTFRATLDWSYNLLTPAEQRLFAGLALFADAFTLSAAAAIFGQEEAADEAMAELLFSLADKNMLRSLPASGDGEPRLRMLRTVREYGLEKLAALDAETTAVSCRYRYAAYYADLAEQGKTGLRGSDQHSWVRRLRQEAHNLMVALEWLLDNHQSAPNAILLARILADTGRFWTLQGRTREMRQWLERARACLPLLPTTLQIKLLNETGNAAQIQGDYPAAENYHQQALALAQQTGDTLQTAHSLHFLASAAGRQGRYVEAKKLFLESLARHRYLPEITPLQLATLLNNLAIVHKRLGEYDEAIALLQETLTIKQAVGDQLGLPATLSNLGNLLILQGNYSDATTHLRQALTLRRQTDDRAGLLFSINQIAALLTAQGRYGPAATLYAAAETLYEVHAVSLTADVRADQRRDLEMIRAQLDAGELAERQNQGAQMTVAEAAAYALDNSAPSA